LGLYQETDSGVLEKVALRKSSVLLKITIQNPQTFQLFTNIIKTESIYNSYWYAKLEGFFS
jgi:hypothetical protein